MLKRIGSSNILELKIKNGNSETIRFDVSSSEKLAKKSGKLFKSQKLSKLKKLQRKKLAISQKLSKSEKLPKFNIKKAEPSFQTSRTKENFYYL